MSSACLRAGSPLYVFCIGNGFKRLALTIAFLLSFGALGGCGPWYESLALGPGHPTLTVLFGGSRLSLANFERLRRMKVEDAAKQFDLSTAAVNELRKLTPKAVQEMVQVIRDIDHQFAGKIPLPTKLTLVALFQNSGAHSVDDEIVVPYQKYRLRNGKDPKSKHFTKHPKYTRAILAHEYGHQIVDKYLETRFPKWDEWRKEAAEDAVGSGNEFLVLCEEFKALGAKAELTLLEKKRLEELTLEVNRRAKVVLARSSNDISISRQLSVSYSEVFADVVAVVSQKDPEAITKAIRLGPTRPSGLPDISFTKPAFPETWTITEEHAVLTPTRFLIWDKYLSRQEFRDRGPEVVSALMESIAEECEFRYVNKRYHMTPKEMNERLINRLRVHLGN